METSIYNYFQQTYLEDLGDFAGEGAVGDENRSANLHGLGKRLVRAGNAGVVTFQRVVRDDVERLALNQLDGLAVLVHARADFGSLRVEHNRAVLVGSLLEGFTEVVHAHAVGLGAVSGVSDLPCGLRGRS